MSHSEFQISEHVSISSQEKYKKPKKQMIYEDGVQQGPWNDQQHQKYLMFLNYHLANKDSKGKKNGQKKKKLFKLMSQFIGTRNLLQCRSHHQKLELKYPTMKTLVQKQKKKYVVENFSDLYRSHYEMMKEIYDEDVEEGEVSSEKKQMGCQTAQDSPQLFMVPFNDYGSLSNSIQLLFMNGFNGSPMFYVMPQTCQQTVWQTQ